MGVLIQDGSNNTIGGTTTADRNIISNNSYGIQLSTATGTANGNKIQGNYIGTNVGGTQHCRTRTASLSPPSAAPTPRGR